MGYILSNIGFGIFRKARIFSMEFDRRQFGQLIGSAISSLALTGWHGVATAGNIYRVKKGDSLWEVSEKFGISVADLKRQNRLSSDTIHPGQKLQIPAGLSQTLRWKIGHKRVDRIRWRKIIAHHSGTTVGDAASFDRFHRQDRRMENGLAYHFVIGNGTGSRDGEIEIGRRWKKQIYGGHVKGQALNKISVGICLVGNFERNHPTARQLKSLYNLTRYLQTGLLRGRQEVLGHKDLPKQSTACPGRFFPLKQYRSHFA